MSLPSLEDSSNLFTSWSLGYLNPLLSLGATRPLTSLDCRGPSKADKADHCVKSTMEEWDKMPMEGKSVWKALWRGYGED